MDPISLVEYLSVTGHHSKKEYMVGFFHFSFSLPGSSRHRFCLGSVLHPLQIAYNNESFASGVITGVVTEFRKLGAITQLEILKVAASKRVPSSLGVNLSWDFASLDASSQLMMFETPTKGWLEYHLGFSIGRVYHELDVSVQERILGLADTIEEFAFYLAFGIATNPYLFSEKRFHELANRNKGFATSFGVPSVYYNNGCYRIPLYIHS